MPAGAAPGLVSAPVAGSKKVAAAVPRTLPLRGWGSQFGMINGFTQRAITGIPAPPPTEDEFDGLNPSALAVARTVNAARLHMREKNVGRFAF